MILLPFIFISPTIKPPDTKPPDTKPPDTKPQDCAEASALGGGLAAGVYYYGLLFTLPTGSFSSVGGTRLLAVINRSKLLLA